MPRVYFGILCGFCIDSKGEKNKGVVVILSNWLPFRERLSALQTLYLWVIYTVICSSEVLEPSWKIPQGSPQRNID